MGRSGSLRGALDRHKGVDYELERQKKLRKAAEKKKQLKQGQEESEDEPEVEVKPRETEKVEKTKTKKGEKTEKTKSKRKQVEPESEEESDESEDEDEQPATYDMSRLVDSDSESDSEDGSDGDDDEENESDDEGVPALVSTQKAQSAEEEASDSDGSDEDEDVPLSDLESLPDDEKQDIIPHQRLTINNTIALTAALHRIALPYDQIPFSAHQSITVVTTTANEIPDVDDDLAREAAFEKQALEAAFKARALLKAEGVAFSRPVDYFAEMVKSEDQMDKVKGQLVKEATARKASAEARRLRDLKKHGKRVQIEKVQERARERRTLNEKVESLKKRRQGAPISNEKETDMFEVGLEQDSRPSRSDRTSRKRGAPGSSGPDGSGPNAKRQRKNDKFGFGGKKKYGKSGDAESSADMSGFNPRRMKKQSGGSGGPKRPGKNRRAKARS